MNSAPQVTRSIGGADAEKISSMASAPTMWPASEVRLNAKVPRTWSRRSRKPSSGGSAGAAGAPTARPVAAMA